MSTMDFFTEIGVSIIAGTGIAILGFFLKQPVILAYIATGVILGSSGFGVISDPTFIESISHVGIMLLLFLIGLEMGVSKLKQLGLVSLFAGVGQVLFTGTIGYLITMAFGFTVIQSAYIAIALTFSSTVIAVKLMSEKGDLGALHGQISIGILIVQDILAIIALIMLAGFEGSTFAFSPTVFGWLLLKVIGLSLVAYVFSRYVFKWLFRKLADSSEMLLLVSLGWCFVMALVAKKLGMSLEIGAFIAGVAMANLVYVSDIISKAKVIRDFFVTIFFIALGAGMSFGNISNLMVPFVVLSSFVLIGNPIIVMSIMKFMGYDSRSSLFTGLNMANISEFSFIVVALGLSLQHISQDIAALVTFIGVTTMSVSSYMISYNEGLYKKLRPVLKLFGKKAQRTPPTITKDTTIIIGMGDTGEDVLHGLLQSGQHVLAVDNNNSVITDLEKRGVSCFFGDIADEDILHVLPLERARCIVITIPNEEYIDGILQYINRQSEENPFVIIVTKSGKRGVRHFNKGADYVVVSPHLGAEHVLQTYDKVFPGVLRDNAQPPAWKESHGHDADYAKLVRSLSHMRMKEWEK